MIERLAKTLVDPNCSPLDIGGTPLWKFQIPKVINMLKALREPTEKMTTAAGVNSHTQARAIWLRMVDAILND